MSGFGQELIHSRPLRTALMASVLWHLVWLFVIYIDVSDPAPKPKLDPKIYFVGPILSDDAFNMILASKPELSATVYRSASQTAPGLEPQTQEMERPDPGDLVSVPLGQSTWTSLRGHLSEEKPYPEARFRSRLPAAMSRPPFPVEDGELTERGLLSAPAFPKLSAAEDAHWVNPEFEITVTGGGRVEEARLIISSGDPETDRVIGRYLEQWQFVPLAGSDAGSGEDKLQTGTVRITEPEERG